MAHGYNCSCFMCSMGKKIGLVKAPKDEGVNMPMPGSDSGSSTEEGHGHKCECGHDHSKEQCDCHK